VAISGSESPANTGPSSFGTLVPTLAVQDLAAESLLEHTPRADFLGAPRPALGGIPLLARIGKGGMGSVYYGLHPRLEVEVAVKVLPPDLAAQHPDLVQRFQREARMAARIKSPHLVSVLDVNAEAGLNYLVMEYVHGRSAGECLKQALGAGRKGLDEATALDICIAAAEGLAAAHAQDIIHRDIKPDNILVPQREGRPELLYKQAKLADLGLARPEQQDAALTVAQTSMGTPGFMAPEQGADAHSAGRPADVFGLGATLFALLAGRAPFIGAQSVKVMLDTMKLPHPPIRTLRPAVSIPTATLIDKCLAKDPAHRPPDAAALLAELRACRAALDQAQTVVTFASGGADVSPAFGPPPSAATQPTVLARAPAPVRTRRLKWLAIAAGAAVVLALVAAGLRLARRAADRRVVVAAATEADQFLNQQGQPDEARKVLEQALRTVPADTPGVPALQKLLEEAARAETAFREQQLLADALGRANKLLENHRPVEARKLLEDAEAKVGPRAPGLAALREQLANMRRMESRHAARERFLVFMRLLAAQQFDDCVPFVEPDAVKRLGTQNILGRLKLLQALTKLMRVTPDDLRVRDVALSEDGQRAEIRIEHRAPVPTKDWRPQPPSFWRLVNGQWYLLIEPEPRQP
jgi:tetratricopeptide (TPR) repeat protein